MTSEYDDTSFAPPHTSFEIQQSKRVHCYQHRRAGISEDGWPKPGDAGNRGNKKHRLKTERDCNVLPDISHGALREVDHSCYVTHAPVEHRCISGFKHNVGSAAHSYPDISGSQRRGIVYTVADLGDSHVTAAGFQFLHDALFVCRQQFGTHRNAQLFANRFGGAAVVAG
jgi:hypothetical protein